jgi:clan AA aspartic protease
MIGSVVQGRIYLPVAIHGENASPMRIVEFVVDTGFEGALTLPRQVIADLQLSFLTDLKAHLADGSQIQTDVYLARVEWAGEEKEIAVLELEGQPLLGTALLQGCDIAIHFDEGGLVSITPF